ncbi:hypothetical protein L596_021022 [Steinernema carpocapsae]|uniref:Uncharacterized protein n=1 Tax=Steinernema carpocapsae TaxID=34508 RepID=A0A4U5MV87_STECR|nr:hypothetical protein L596_021022 [Steinernema carpocapsae]
MTKPGHYPENLARIGTNCQLETKDTGFNGNASSGSLATFELDNIFKSSDQFRSDPNFRRNSMIRLIGSQANIYHTYERCLQHENQLYKSYAIGQGEISLTATKINVDQLAILAKYRPTLDILQAEREGNTDDIFVATLTTSAKVFVNEWNTTNLEVTVNAENCVKLKVPSDRVMILQRCAEFSFLYFIDESSSEITSPHEWVDMRIKENPDMTLTFSCKLKTDRIIPNMIANSWKVQSSGISSTIMRTAPVEGYLNDINMINELAGLLILDDSLRRPCCLVSAVVPAVHRDYGAHMEVRRHERKYSLSRNARKYAEFVFMTSDMLILKGRSSEYERFQSLVIDECSTIQLSVPCATLVDGRIT